MQAHPGYTRPMAKIDDVPTSVTGAGLDHDYTAEPVLSTLILVNAPLDPEHQHVGLSQAAYDEYITREVNAGRSYSTTINNPAPGSDIALELSYDQAVGYNYGRLTVAGRKWYFFADPVFYNRTVTKFTVTLDPFPSFTNWGLGYGVVERGHVGVAVSQSDTFGNQYLTAAEPIEGSAAWGVLTADAFASAPSEWTVMVISANDLRGNGSATPYFEHHVQESDIANASPYGTAASVGPLSGEQFTVPEAHYPWLDPSPGPGGLKLYVPVVTPSPSSTIDGVTAGGGVYLFTPQGFAAWMTIMQGASWIVDGIVDIRLVPGWALSGGGAGTYPATAPATSPTNPAWATAAAIPNYQAAVSTGATSGIFHSGWRDTILGAFGAGVYRKLVTAPYCEVLIGNGESVVTYLPEQMNTSGVQINAVTGALHGEPVIRVTPDYNSLGPQQSITVPFGGRPGTLTSGFGRGASNPASADMGPINTAYSNFANRQVVNKQQALALTLTETNVQMTMGINGIQTVAGVVGGAMAGGAAGAATSAVSGAIGYATSAISANNSLEILDISQDGSIDIAAYQLGASNWFSVNVFDAWVQTLRAVSGHGVGERLASAWRAVQQSAFQVIITTPSIDRAYALLSMWRRYGYMIGRPFTPSRLDVMTHFSYWKTDRATITGNVGPEHRRGIAEAFDRGVTVWNVIAEIGSDQSTANQPVTGAYY